MKQSLSKMIVYKDGKAGMIDSKNEIIIPVEYDLIAKSSSMSDIARLAIVILLEKNGLYGITKIRAKNSREYEMFETVEPVFKYIPHDMLENYYNVKGLTLYALYDGCDFKGYANKDGKEYFKE